MSKNWGSNGASKSENEMDTASIAMMLANRVTERMQAHPVSTLAAAFGVGYVLGGGLPRFAVRIGAAVAVRALSNELLRQITGNVSSTSFEPHAPTAQPSA